ncbi:hypothetical protein C0J52_13854 [Blattella germanica]|nr:hypothetical protein C0J52_13854 [Blattella germanica]
MLQERYPFTPFSSFDKEAVEADVDYSPNQIKESLPSLMLPSGFETSTRKLSPQYWVNLFLSSSEKGFSKPVVKDQLMKKLTSSPGVQIFFISPPYNKPLMAVYLRST